MVCFLFTVIGVGGYANKQTCGNRKLSAVLNKGIPHERVSTVFESENYDLWHFKISSSAFHMTDDCHVIPTEVKSRLGSKMGVKITWKD